MDSPQLQDVPVWSAKLSGELRERIESFRNPGFGLDGSGRDVYVLHRAVATTEIRHGEEQRLHAEFVAARVSGWNGRPPSTQRDELDVLQFYVEESPSSANGRLTIRAGRQAVALGSSRLVSVRESTNLRRAFDGLRLSWNADGQRTITGFVLKPVAPATGAFDDRGAPGQRLWGVYATSPMKRVEGLRMDAYYLGIERRQAQFANVIDTEHRHTFGLRLFGERSIWDWNAEGAWQTGSLGRLRIRAWTASIDAGLRPALLAGVIRLGMKIDAASGDRNPLDSTLGTFNPLFPRLPYFSEADLAIPANLVDIQPGIALAVTPRLHVEFSWNALWKQTSEDAFYAAPLSPVPAVPTSRRRALGEQSTAAITWHASASLWLSANFVAFVPQSLLREAGGRSGDMLVAAARWMF